MPETSSPTECSPSAPLEEADSSIERDTASSSRALSRRSWSRVLVIVVSMRAAVASCASSAVTVPEMVSEE